MTALFENLEADLGDTDDLDTPPKEVPFTQADGFEPPKGAKPRETKIKKEVQSLYTAAALAVFPFDQFIGSQIAENAENCAVAWDELARQNPQVKKMLESLIQTSAYGTIIAAHMPIIVAIATKYVPQLRHVYESNFRESE